MGQITAASALETLLGFSSGPAVNMNPLSCAPTFTEFSVAWTSSSSLIVFAVIDGISLSSHTVFYSPQHGLTIRPVPGIVLDRDGTPGGRNGRKRASSKRPVKKLCSSKADPACERSLSLVLTGIVAQRFNDIVDGNGCAGIPRGDSYAKHETASQILRRILDTVVSELQDNGLESDTSMDASGSFGAEATALVESASWVASAPITNGHREMYLAWRHADAAVNIPSKLKNQVRATLRHTGVNGGLNGSTNDATRSSASSSLDACESASSDAIQAANDVFQEVVGNKHVEQVCIASRVLPNQSTLFFVSSGSLKVYMIPYSEGSSEGGNLIHLLHHMNSDGSVLSMAPMQEALMILVFTDATESSLSLHCCRQDENTPSTLMSFAKEDRPHLVGGERFSGVFVGQKVYFVTPLFDPEDASSVDGFLTSRRDKAGVITFLSVDVVAIDPQLKCAVVADIVIGTEHVMIAFDTCRLIVFDILDTPGIVLKSPRTYTLAVENRAVLSCVRVPGPPIVLSALYLNGNVSIEACVIPCCEAPSYTAFCTFPLVEQASVVDMPELIPRVPSQAQCFQDGIDFAFGYLKSQWSPSPSSCGLVFYQKSFQNLRLVSQIVCLSAIACAGAGFTGGMKLGAVKHRGFPAILCILGGSDAYTVISREQNPLLRVFCQLLELFVFFDGTLNQQVCTDVQTSWLRVVLTFLDQVLARCPGRADFVAGNLPGNQLFLLWWTIFAPSFLVRLHSELVGTDHMVSQVLGGMAAMLKERITPVLAASVSDLPAVISCPTCNDPLQIGIDRMLTCTQHVFFADPVTFKLHPGAQLQRCIGCGCTASAVASCCRVCGLDHAPIETAD